MEMHQANSAESMPMAGVLHVIKRNGIRVVFDVERIRATITRIATGYLRDISIDLIVGEVMKNIYNNVPTQEVEQALIMAAVTFIEKDPEYNVLAAQLLLHKAYREQFDVSVGSDAFTDRYRQSLMVGLAAGVEQGVFDSSLLTFDVDYLASKLVFERDQLLQYLGAQTLYDRYFFKVGKTRYELPQTFWMRVAMGLAINEPNKNERAIEFYDAMSSLRYVPSTPTLFHSGFVRAQLSSCYLTTIEDDLGHIFKCLGDNAQLSKWAGGIGNDWTNVRGLGSWIKGIRATSQGTVPYMKLANDVVTAITRSGIRRGGTVGYLETWHIDIEDFLDLRRNTGDERRRTHDMNTANWIPDLFIKRVMADQEWTLFSPELVPELHHIYGAAFETKYQEYERTAQQGQIAQYKTVSAVALWRKMLSRLFETGHPWITFKDPSNIRSPQDHAGVVYSSNLCTEIMLNTSAEETAVCNLGSINLRMHVTETGQLDEQQIAKTVETGVRMLDNVIDPNFYPTAEAKTSNMRHRPVGLGQMGFQDLLFKMNIAFGSETAIGMADYVSELISYHTILSSSKLAKERGVYQSYPGSKWDRNIFPVDTLDLYEKERGVPVEINRIEQLDWRPVREHVKAYGMRNSNVMAIAPNATISNIAGSFPCIEPIYRNLYVKSNVAGEFTIVNSYLVAELKQLNLWSDQMLDLLKYHDGELQKIERIPQELKEKYKTAFELDPLHLVKINATRGKWIDQSQSYNVFMKGVSGKQLSDIYLTGWRLGGMKSFYYLRTLGASQIEKSTLSAEKFGFTQTRKYSSIEPSSSAGAACDPFDQSCESCQ